MSDQVQQATPEAPTATLPEAEAPRGAFCESCGGGMAAADKFCPACGMQREPVS